MSLKYEPASEPLHVSERCTQDYASNGAPVEFLGRVEC